jgi:hypothetical protein
MSTPGQESPAMDATWGPISLVSASARPGTARTSAGASEATDSRCGLRWRPLGRVLVVRRAGGVPRCAGAATRPAGGVPRCAAAVTHRAGAAPRPAGGVPRPAGGVPRSAGGVPRCAAAATHRAGAATRPAGGVPRCAAAERARRTTRRSGAATRLAGCAGAVPRRAVAMIRPAAARLTGSGPSRCRIVIGSRSG